MQFRIVELAGHAPVWDFLLRIAAALIECRRKCGLHCGMGGSVGAVKFYEFVVDAKDEEWRSPLSYEERHVSFLGGFEADGDDHAGQSRSQINAWWNLRGDLLDGCGYLVFLYFPCIYTIVGHEWISLSSLVLYREMQWCDAAAEREFVPLGAINKAGEGFDRMERKALNCVWAVG
jgi:hypothetical protein